MLWCIAVVRCLLTKKPILVNNAINLNVDDGGYAKSG